MFEEIFLIFGKLEQVTLASDSQNIKTTTSTLCESHQVVMQVQLVKISL